MCTVTFIPAKDKIFITSNRDEKLVRKSAIAPAVYKTGDHLLVFPKDGDAGGTWIGLKESGDAAVLLNGAFLPHIAELPYRKSRGLVFLDILGAKHPSSQLIKADLDNIEPFSIVLFESNSLHEFRWDGYERYCRQLSVNRPHIWSSATLYDGLVIKKREQWFARFLSQHPNPTQKDILHFHKFTGDGDAANDLMMNRDCVYSTVSITSMLLTPDRGSMKYEDLVNHQYAEKKIEFITSTASI